MRKYVIFTLTTYMIIFSCTPAEQMIHFENKHSGNTKIVYNLDQSVEFITDGSTKEMVKMYLSTLPTFVKMGEVNTNYSLCDTTLSKILPNLDFSKFSCHTDSILLIVEDEVSTLELLFSFDSMEEYDKKRASIVEAVRTYAGGGSPFETPSTFEGNAYFDALTTYIGNLSESSILKIENLEGKIISFDQPDFIRFNWDESINRDTIASLEDFVLGNYRNEFGQSEVGENIEAHEFELLITSKKKMKILNSDYERTRSRKFALTRSIKKMIAEDDELNIRIKVK